MVIEIVMVADNIDVMSARAECGDLWKPEEHSDARHFSKRRYSYRFFEDFQRPDVLKGYYNDRR